MPFSSLQSGSDALFKFLMEMDENALPFHLLATEMSGEHAGKEKESTEEFCLSCFHQVCKASAEVFSSPPVSQRCCWRACLHACKGGRGMRRNKDFNEEGN